MRRFKLGDQVRVKKSQLLEFVPLFDSLYVIPGTGSIPPQHIGEIKFIAGALGGAGRSGRVIGFGAPSASDRDQPNVRVRLKNRFGVYEGYFDPEHLQKKVWK